MTHKTSARGVRLPPAILLLAAAVFSGPGIAAEALAPPGVAVPDSTLARWSDAYAEFQDAHPGSAAPQAARYLNALALERSPYLLQHATNPVNWVSWSEQNLEAARTGGKPIFLSIGYSTCHWCHVMNRESFSDARIAGLINANFVAIKVDREELPVVDRHYSDILAMVKGSAGWPLTAVLNPDGEVILIDSYLDPEALTRTLERIVELGRTRPEALEQSARFIASLARTSDSGDAGADTGGEALTLEELTRISDSVVAAMDPVHGGLAGPQKFPNEPLLAFLLAVESREPSEKRREALILQLDAMVTSGLYDAVNGGFFRYSTATDWRDPHYEKMLYNQAQLLRIYSEAYSQFGQTLYKWLTDDLTRFLYAWLHAPGQGFRAAIDAETAGVEGGYYLWREAALDSVSAEDAEAAGLRLYPARGKTPLVGVLVDYPQSSAAISVRRAMRHEKREEPRPFIDTKLIAAWNAATVSGLAAAWTLAPRGERDEARSRLDALGDELWSALYDPDGKRLHRTSYGGGRQVPGTLEDYAFMLAALVDLYDITADKRWLARAGLLADAVLDEFVDDSGRFRPASARVAGLVGTEPAPMNDAELPAADAVALSALWRLSIRRGDARLKRMLERPVARLRDNFRAEPFARLFAGRVLADIDLGSVSSLQYFAAGNGRVDVSQQRPGRAAEQACETVVVNIRLENGWHVNSSEPLQDYLRPTAVSVSTPVSTPISVDYPRGRVSKLGFQEDALSVYDGEFEIVIKRNVIKSDGMGEACSGWSSGAELTLNLQACTDEICLLPEVLRVRLPAPTEKRPVAQGQ